MGLDAVEIVLRTEDLFGLHIEDSEAAAVRTVGDFYRLLCSKLNVTPLPSPITSVELPIITRKEKARFFGHTRTPLPAPPELLPWSPQTIWDALVAVFVDQLSLKPNEVLYHATIVEDLGVC